MANAHIDVKHFLGVPFICFDLFACNGIPQTDRTIRRSGEDILCAVVVSSYVHRSLMSVESNLSALPQVRGRLNASQSPWCVPKAVPRTGHSRLDQLIRIAQVCATGWTHACRTSPTAAGAMLQVKLQRLQERRRTSLHRELQQSRDLFLPDLAVTADAFQFGAVAL